MKNLVSVNFEILDQYDFKKLSFDEVLFFEWLVTKRIGFKNETFPYKQKDITDETGIKRKRLEKIKSNFFYNYKLVVFQGGKHNTTSFTVSNNFVKFFINDNVKLEERKNLQKRILSAVKSGIYAV